MENRKKEAKLIFNAGTARSLLRAGCVVVDIKQSRENADKTIFAFRNDEHFQAEFERINKEIAASKVAQEDDSE
jgi:hypothetical protein